MSVESIPSRSRMYRRPSSRRVNESTEGYAIAISLCVDDSSGPSVKYASPSPTAPGSSSSPSSPPLPARYCHSMPACCSRRTGAAARYASSASEAGIYWNFATKPSRPFFVNVSSSSTCAGSIAVKLKHDLPCIRFSSEGESVFSSAGAA